MVKTEFLANIYFDTQKDLSSGRPGQGQNSIDFYSSFFWLVPYAGLWLNKMNLVVEP